MTVYTRKWKTYLVRRWLVMWQLSSITSWLLCSLVCVGKLYLEKCKTSDTYGLAKVDASKELDTAIRKCIKVNPSDYVLISSNNEPLSSSQITRRLNAIFGKRVSFNVLRYMYLTNFYMSTPPLKDMERVARDMEHNSWLPLNMWKNKKLTMCLKFV